MGGIYGDTLLAFPEQFRPITVFEMTPEINGGWTIVPDSSQTITGVYQHTAGKQIKESNGNMAKTSGLELWTGAAGLDGKFGTDDEGEICRIKGSNNWSHEGGFYKYTLEKVVGNNGTEHDDAAWNIGTNNFS